jgi:hypothetical protein
MHFYTGIAFSKLAGNDVLVAAATWYRSNTPWFNTRDLNLQFMKKNLCSVVFIRNSDIPTTVNSACHRSVEQLLINKYVSIDTKPDVTLLVKDRLLKQSFILPTEKNPRHWLLKAAETALTAWERGER